MFKIVDVRKQHISHVNADMSSILLHIYAYDSGFIKSFEKSMHKKSFGMII